jgi:hypothetical protein
MTQARDVIVITSCTNRKKKSDVVLTLDGAEGATSLRALARGWYQQVQAVPSDGLWAARELYVGRSISEARQAAASVAAPLYIASAGHGLVHGDERIPSYDVTVAAAPDNSLYQCLLRLQAAPAAWWQALVHAFGAQRSLADLIKTSTNALALLAVPAAYLELLADEFALLSDDEVGRLCIVTSPHGASGLPTRLQSSVLPYDERLEGLDGYAGTRSDFPQRALRHFVEVVRGHTLPLEQAREHVRAAMAALRKPVLPERQRKSDEEIIALLRQHWQRLNGSATALLRYLRDDALVACEQSRFRTLRQLVLVEQNDEVRRHG